MEFVREDQAVAYYNEAGNRLAYITYSPAPNQDNVVIANGTFVDPSLRGQGIAEKLLEELVAWMEEEGNKITPTCSYVVKKFNEEPDKYDHINANA